MSMSIPPRHSPSDTHQLVSSNGMRLKQMVGKISAFFAKTLQSPISTRPGPDFFTEKEFSVRNPALVGLNARRVNSISFSQLPDETVRGSPSSVLIENASLSPSRSSGSSLEIDQSGSLPPSPLSMDEGSISPISGTPSTETDRLISIDSVRVTPGETELSTGSKRDTLASPRTAIKSFTSATRVPGESVSTTNFKIEKSQQPKPTAHPFPRASSTQRVVPPFVERTPELIRPIAIPVGTAVSIKVSEVGEGSSSIRMAIRIKSVSLSRISSANHLVGSLENTPPSSNSSHTLLLGRIERLPSDRAVSVPLQVRRES